MMHSQRCFLDGGQDLVDHVNSLGRSVPGRDDPGRRTAGAGQRTARDVRSLVAKPVNLGDTSH